MSTPLLGNKVLFFWGIIKYDDRYFKEVVAWGGLPLDSHDLLVVIKVAAILNSEGWLYLNQTKATI